ncbi:FecR family protein [Candidatus Woesearchaeota archaeon]|nr:FecR family protein [Candidatus Woesearchaeota archaeon]MBW3016362.1 FecR family protein [Candidatus Woesearchaeota archaeon]
MAKEKKFSKLTCAILGILVILLIVAGIAFFTATGSPVTKAFLNIFTGETQVDHGKGYLPAKDGQELALNDKVKTLPESEAAVVLQESVIINLEPETEILIKDLAMEHIKVTQNTGTTWNKFTGLTGVEGLSIETPTTVATVRGTFFGVKMDQIIVGEGNVEVTYQGEKYNLKEGQKAVIKDGKLTIEEQTPEDKAEIIAQMQKTIKSLKTLRTREVDKHPVLAGQMKKRYQITDEMITEHLEKADRGEYDLNEVIQKSPVKIASVYKIKEFTEKIIEINKKIQEIK